MSGAGPWRVEPGSDPAVAAALERPLADPVAWLRGGTVLREMGERLTGRAELAGIGPVLVKVERRRGLDELLRALVRPPRARQEWAAAARLCAAGVAVPRPLALAEQGPAFAPRATVYVAQWLEGRDTLLERLSREEGPAAGDLLARAGALLARVHAAGFDHADLHAGNLLVGPGPEAALHVVDLHRGRLVPPGPAAAGRALARLLVSLRLTGSDEARERLFAGYLGAGGAPGGAALERAFRAALGRLEAHHRRKHDRHALRPGPTFDAAGGLGRGVLRRSLPAADAARALRTHDEALAAGDARVLKDQRKSAVTREGWVLVKETRPVGLSGLAKRWLAPWRLSAGHRNAHRLEVRGYATARPLAWLRRAGRVFTLYENLEWYPRLDHRVRALWAAGAPAERAALLEASADLVARLHAEGVYHGDLKAVNLLVGGTPAAPRLFLVDTDRCRFGRGPLDRGRRLRNLAQLAASIPRGVSRAERLRWWRRYALRCGAADDPRQAARAVAALVARKLAVVDAPIE